MTTTVAILLFCGGLLLSLMSSVVLSERLDRWATASACRRG